MANLMDLPYEIRRQIIFYALLPDFSETVYIATTVAAELLDSSRFSLFVHRKCSRMSQYSINCDEFRGYWGTETITMLMCVCRRLYIEVEETCYSEFSLCLRVKQIPLFVSATSTHIHSFIKHLDLKAELNVEYIDRSPVLSIHQSKPYSAWSLLRRNSLNVQTVVCRVAFARDFRTLDTYPCSRNDAVELTMAMLRIWKDVQDLHVELASGRFSDAFIINAFSAERRLGWKEEHVVEECARLARSGQW